MAFYNFRKDLANSKITEQEVATIIEKVHNAKILAFETTGAFDILTEINGKEVKFEVKEDFICEKTGNVGLEFECRGKPSGIQTTKADFYIYKLHTSHGVVFVEHTIEDIKNKIINLEYFRIVNGGDKGSNSMFYLFKYDAFLRNGITLLPI